MQPTDAQQSTAPPEPDIPAGDATLTICICTVNRPDSLRACLQSIAEGEVKPHHVLVSDDSATPKIAQAVCADFPFATWAAGPRRGLCANRNSIISKVATTHVSLIDDDATVSRAFVRQALHHANNDPARTIVTGALLELGTRLVLPGASDFCGHFTYGPSPKVWWQQQNNRFETIHLNCNVIPRAAFDIAEFDELIEFGFEDMDLCSHLLAEGYRIEFDPEMVNSHFPPPKSKTISRQRWRHWTQARYYTSLKRYFVWNRRPTLGLAYLVVSPAKLILHSLKWRKWEQVGPAPVELFSAFRLFLKFLRQRSSRARLHPLPA